MLLAQVYPTMFYTYTSVQDSDDQVLVSYIKYCDSILVVYYGILWYY